MVLGNGVNDYEALVCVRRLDAGLFGEEMAGRPVVQLY
jgi:hypothetical protein